ncbi:helix-turn-helix domain-containing protein [Pseudobacter ginsenosidimutans]|jgi:AraC-like DNA-binding protein|nr:helix-turn-helix domain-containing protein [Pseudobacter ginsenosidimutans]
MQPQLKNVPHLPGTSSFLLRDMIVPYFSNPFHFHPELELTFIVQGSGIRFVGDNIEYFGSGDMVLVGANLPHRWKNDKVYYELDNDLYSRAIVIQFRENFLRSDAGELPEMADIRNMLTLAKRGLKIVGATRQKVAKRMIAMLHQNSIERIASLLLILSNIAASNEYAVLSGTSIDQSYTRSDTERISRVYAYIMENFTDEINLQDVAGVANMSLTAFCRYFKSVTNKTFSTFLLETRLNYACKLLLSDSFNITQVAFRAGFNNLSYFNRQFKKMKGISPLQYKKQFLQAQTY